MKRDETVDVCKRNMYVIYDLERIVFCHISEETL